MINLFFKIKRMAPLRRQTHDTCARCDSVYQVHVRRKHIDKFKRKMKAYSGNWRVVALERFWRGIQSASRWCYARK